ncbi:hypothetical protein BofuT4_P104940.1 [Botrytis cinerea T4]|uniref:Uncharacterized protein n=1 Tax=Botryotinia fuckeliana (strain T4) TaxID=999810 RepID=G2YAB0_BOTF4|nr:hypothetical protein BofuT4_P104940.1 [Botrytis cinerea T4]
MSAQTHACQPPLLCELKRHNANYKVDAQYHNRISGFLYARRRWVQISEIHQEITLLIFPQTSGKPLNL